MWQPLSAMALQQTWRREAPQHRSLSALGRTGSVGTTHPHYETPYPHTTRPQTCGEECGGSNTSFFPSVTIGFASFSPFFQHGVYTFEELVVEAVSWTSRTIS